MESDMSVKALYDYDFPSMDRAEVFDDDVLVYVHWEGNPIFCSAACFRVPKTMPFGEFVTSFVVPWAESDPDFDRENALDRPLSGLAGRPAKCHATSAWFSASTLTANGCPSRNWQAFDVRVSVTWQSAGSREIGVKAVTVAPCGRPSSMLRQLTTVTPVAKSPKTPLSSRVFTLTSAF